MPLLLNVPQNAEGPAHNELRAKATECAGLIAIAVGCDVFCVGISYDHDDLVVTNLSIRYSSLIHKVL
ncbi:hypothetical protein BDN72DRAFT_906991 [Pluteus cervinus]|uniref:Uncharacterized protein n=1 Tax=Pluteus cervinus TaxID=181527 RepID=A0ACD2ZXQ5_9AGAR|nr:hypothetical protein BDN72DRAFT_906991 [Pluteus cervinus]